MTGRFSDLADEIRRCESIGRLRRLTVRRPVGRYIEQPDGTRLVNFASNDYLGLVADPPRWRQAMIGPVTGAVASPLVTGWSQAHRQLADNLAAFEQTEAAIVLSSGYAACLSTVATLCRDGDLLLSDSLNHASLIDGCRLSRATRVVYRHGDLGHVDEILAGQRHRHRRAWIVTDSVFSMDGDVAPLAGLVDLAGKYDAEVIVDEAHGTGVLGATGGGLCEALGLQAAVAIRIGTLSKAVGLQGGFVAGPAAVIDYLIQHARGFIFATALAPAIAEAAAETIARLPELAGRRTRLHNRIAQYRREMGFDPVAAGMPHVPIVPHIVGGDRAAVGLSTRLAAAGYLAPAIRPPTVPDGSARVRICLSAAHRRDDVAGLTAAILATSRIEARPVPDGPPDD